MNNKPTSYWVVLSAFISFLFTTYFWLLSDKGAQPVAEWASAIGTLAAVVVSLYLASQGKVVSFDFEADVEIYNLQDQVGKQAEISIYGFNYGKSSDAIREVKLHMNNGKQTVVSLIQPEDKVIDIKPETYVNMKRKFNILQKDLYSFALDRDKMMTIELVTFRGRKYKKEVRPNASGLEPLWGLQPDHKSGQFTVRNENGSVVRMSRIKNEAVKEKVRSLAHGNELTEASYQYNEEQAELILAEYKKEFREEYM
ncbi:hypothetical protein [Weissella cibaria]|uniref:hypothetical protein n=1 Tax=Weissella cibaria TaxID=137591 RepID=UPI0013D958FD|nr:hypothetical protein [Weissella cibaria]NFA02251.1 hypothetical protein [Weissella cibaria]